MDSSMGKQSFRQSFSPGRTPAYWWNDNIAEQVFMSEKKGAKGQKSLQEKYMDHHRSLKKAVRKSKFVSYKEILDSADNDIWRESYRLVMTKKKKKRS